MTTTTAKAMIDARGAVDPWGRNRSAMTEHAALMEKLNQEARDNWDNEAWHRQVAVDLAESLDVGFTFNNLFASWIQTQNVGEFDRIRIRERRGLKAFWTSRGGYIEESQIRAEEFELPRDTIGFHVSEHIDKLRANFATTIDDLVTLGQSRLEAEVNRRVFSLIRSSIPLGDTNAATTPQVTKDVLDSSLSAVRDAIDPDGRGPVPITIAGRASVIDVISEFPNFSNEANEEIRQRGRLGVYRGANIVQINNYVDEDGEQYLPDNELYVFGGNVGRVVNYGGLQVKTWDENTVDYRHYRARRDTGVSILYPEQARRILVSSA